MDIEEALTKIPVYFLIWLFAVIMILKLILFNRRIRKMPKSNRLIHTGIYIGFVTAFFSIASLEVKDLLFINIDSESNSEAVKTAGEHLKTAISSYVSWFGQMVSIVGSALTGGFITTGIILKFEAMPEPEPVTLDKGVIGIQQDNRKLDDFAAVSESVSCAFQKKI
ncbi:hypothetical protein AAFX60_017390 [Aliivibrio fischeri]